MRLASTSSSDLSYAIRRATADDAPALARLAALDSTRPPAGEVLVAVVDGAFWAALCLDDGRVVADPFRPSAHAVELLRLRAEHLARARRGLTLPRRALRALRA